MLTIPVITLGFLSFLRSFRIGSARGIEDSWGPSRAGQDSQAPWLHLTSKEGIKHFLPIKLKAEAIYLGRNKTVNIKANA